MLSAPGAGRTAACRATALGGTAAVLACLTVIGGTSPALADSVRNQEQWVLDAIHAQAAWTSSQGQGVTVAVIDSGVNPDVPDLVGSVRLGPNLTGVDTPPSNPGWGVHGTWMASLIAGHGHGDAGSSGIIGVAPQSKILSIRVITDKNDPENAAYQREPPSRSQRELAAGITDAVRGGAGVISMSLGYGAPSRPVRLALQDAFAHNVMVVASSGNSGDAAGAAGRDPAPYSFPADYPGVLGVGAVYASGQPAPFSSENFSVQVAAPGVEVPAEGRDSGYWLVSGTSPACAITAGVAALIKSKYPGLSDPQVSNAITGSTWHRPPGGYDQEVGFGTVNAAAALAMAGRLAAAQSRSPGQDVSSASHFSGSAAAPAPPVAPRGPLALVAYCLLGVACLAVVAVAALRVVARPSPRAARPLAYPGPPPSVPAQGAAPPRETGPYGSHRRGDTDPPGYDYGPGDGYPAGNGYPPRNGYQPGDGYPPGDGYQPGDGYPPGNGVQPGPASEPGHENPLQARQPGTAPLRPIPPRPAPAPPWSQPRPDPGAPGAPGAGPFEAGPPASRRHGARPGDGPPPGSIRFGRSSRSPGRHAAPAQPPSDAGDAQ